MCAIYIGGYLYQFRLSRSWTTKIKPPLLSVTVDEIRKRAFISPKPCVNSTIPEETVFLLSFLLLHTTSMHCSQKKKCKKWQFFSVCWTLVPSFIVCSCTRMMMMMKQVAGERNLYKPSVYRMLLHEIALHSGCRR
jgi:hypothetical protein